MKKPARRTGKKTSKMSKNAFEERFSYMVQEYQQAKEVLDSMDEGSSEYAKQKVHCDKLFAKAERFVNAN
ncbi:hypothetical protein [Vibrio hippocampi]|uniref:Lacal_2735 family protein n=1 Tax=Vibrio hippocampi TaxID=654686 RepID=A0ABM8ZL01_9VIBR|nr:hypothetical protein [Vibrio hippocampi]CAH0528683.1 hypothetical protein VHP8226_02709 [Vibrio hippocampi]